MTLQIDARGGSAATVRADPASRAGYWDGPASRPADHERPLPQRSAGVDAENAVADVVQRQRIAAAVTVDGSGTNAARRTQSQTPDGKPVLSDVLYQGREVTVQRERTFTDYGGQYYVAADELTLVTGDADDRVEVANGADGVLAVTVNGERVDLRLAEGQTLQVRAGGGSDVVALAADVAVDTVVRAGDGDNRVRTGAGDDRVFSGGGDDTVDAGEGDNYVSSSGGSNEITVGDGSNVVYGGSGSDRIATGDGRNYLEGGAGDDRFVTGSGHAMVSSGAGDDIVEGGGNAVVYTGTGRDTVEGAVRTHALGGAGAHDLRGGEVVAVEAAPGIGSRGIAVHGSAEFVQRVEADLAMLRSSPAGQRMLAELDAAAARSGNGVTIQELANEQNGYALSSGDEILGGRPGAGSDVEVRYNPDFFLGADFPAPVGVLYHELSHAYNGVNGTFQPGTYSGSDRVDAGGVPNAERQAVGVETTAPAYDFDGDPATPATTHNPYPLTENGLREELGLPLRLHYTL